MLLISKKSECPSPQFTPRAFGEKMASVRGIQEVFKGLFDNKGPIRLPADKAGMRQALIAAAVGGSLGGVKGYFFPGYDEKLDDEGRVISKKKISPIRGALQQAGIGASTGALANYAGQVVGRYNPEIDRFLFGRAKYF